MQASLDAAAPPLPSPSEAGRGQTIHSDGGRRGSGAAVPLLSPFLACCWFMTRPLPPPLAGVFASLDTSAPAPPVPAEGGRRKSELSGQFRSGAGMQASLDAGAPPLMSPSPEPRRGQSQYSTAQRRGSGVYYSIDGDAVAPDSSEPSHKAATVHSEAHRRGAGVFACLDTTLPLPEVPASSVVRAGNMDSLAEFTAQRALGIPVSGGGGGSSHPSEISAVVAAAIAR